MFLILISVTGNCYSQNNALKASYPFDLETLKKLSDNRLQNDSVAPVYLAGGFTYINTKSKLPVIEETFEEAYPFVRDFGLVKVDGKYGIINRHGDFVVKPTFPQFQLVWNVNYGVWLDVDRYFSFIQGKLINEPEILCAEPASPQLYCYKQGKKFGLIFKKDTIKKPIFDSVYAITNRIAIVSLSGKIGIIDHTGKFLNKLNYDSYAGPTGYNSTLKFALKQKDTWHYFNENKKLFESKFQPTLSDGVFLVRVDKRYNYLDDEGNLALSKNYKWISDYGDIAINENDNIVFLFKGKKVLTYY